MKDRTWMLMANESRRKILLELAKGERTVSELIEVLSISQPQVSTHLAELRRHKMVAWRQDKSFRFYSLDPSGVVALRLQYERLFGVLQEGLR